VSLNQTRHQSLMLNSLGGLGDPRTWDHTIAARNQGRRMETILKHLTTVKRHSVGRRMVRSVAARKLPLLALALAGLLNGFAAMSAQAQTCPKMTEIRIQEWTGDIINLVPWVAEAQGFFRNHCIDIKFVPIASGPAAMSAAISGAIDFSNGGPDITLRFRGKGADIRLVGNMYAAQWSALVARNGLELAHLSQGYPAIMKDLVGKRIGVTALGGTTEAFVRSSFEGAGLSEASATFVAVGGVTTAVPALRNNVVDAAMMFGTGPDLAEVLNAGKIVLDLRKRDVGPDSLKALWGATLSWAGYGPSIDKKPEAVIAFVAANNEAIAWLKDPKNREATYAIVKARMTLPIDTADPDAALKRIVDVNANGVGAGLPKESIDGWNKYLISLKQIDKPMPYDELVWRSGRP
jgi:NitT/TauT family transport system substrate-binding protein